MSATTAEPLELEQDELVRGRAEISGDSSAGVGDRDSEGGGGQPPSSPPDDRRGRGGRGGRPPRWLRALANAILLLLFAGAALASAWRLREALAEGRP
jgi:hypothetical protein